MDKLENKIMEMLPDIQAAVEQGIAYGGDLFIRYISFEIFLRSIQLIGNIIVSVVFIYLIYHSHKEIQKHYKKHCESGIFMAYFLTLFAVILSFAAVEATYNDAANIGKAIYIPEIYVLEQFNK